MVSTSLALAVPAGTLNVHITVCMKFLPRGYRRRAFNHSRAATGRWRRLAFRRLDVAHTANEGGDLLARPFEMNSRRRRRMLFQTNSGPPRPRRPDRAWRKTAAAVGADVEQHRLDAFGAEGALVAADAGVGCSGRQVLVAPFAIGP